MNKLFITLVMINAVAISVAAFSCNQSAQSESTSYQKNLYVCDCEQKDKLETYLRESIADANNMSDEEMEDVIHQLRVDGYQTFCQLQPVWVKKTGEANWEWEVDFQKEKQDSCKFIMDGN